MLKLLTCVQGHSWEVQEQSGDSEAGDAASFRCPMCGTPADELPLLDLAPSETTLSPPVQPTSTPKAPPLLDAKCEPQITGYEILQALGKNKKGVMVFRARQVLINRVVLLKVVLAKDDAGQASWGALRGEANTLAKLTHPNIPQIHEVGERDRQLFYNVVEHFEGVSLLAILQGKQISPRTAASFVENVARAVHHAHEKGVAHRNLQPASILVEAKDGMPLHRCAFKIVDFGLAVRPIEGDVNDLELQDKLPYYLSPEQAWGYAKDIGPSCDVYALGVMLYELLAGQAPFRGQRTSEVIEQIETRPPARLDAGNRRVPTDLVSICRKCLQKPPRKRYASALALAEDLRRYQDGVPILARDIGVFARVYKWTIRRPASACIVLLLVLLLLSTLTAYFLGESQAEPNYPLPARPSR